MGSNYCFIDWQTFCLPRNWNVLLIIYIILVALFTARLILFSNVSLDSKVTLKSFCFLCVSIVLIALFVVVKHLLLPTLFSPISIFTFVWVKFKHQIATPLVYDGYILLKYTLPIPIHYASK